MTSRLGARLREMMRGEPEPPQPALPGDLGIGSGEPPRGILIDVIGEDATPQTVGRRLAHAAAHALGGAVHDTSAGPCVVVERLYDHQHLHGLLRIGECAAHVHHDAPGLPILAGASWAEDPPAGEQPTFGIRAFEGGLARGDILFLDLETTGLTGGAGTYAFLVGCGWFEPGGFRVRQYFMVGHALERALLAAVRERLDSCGPLVTYNGKTFDLPVLETRFIFNRQRTPLGDRPHLDMLHPARRLWRGVRPPVNVPGAQRESCTLSALEHALLGVQRTGDVPGFEMPTRYFAFLRSGDASPLEPVFEHNRLDLVSLAALTARACRLLAEDHPAVEGPRECLGIARLLGRVAAWDRAEACYRRAINLASRSWQAEDEQVRLEALHALALRCRRTARYLDAAAHWEAITRARRCPPTLLRDALEALAVHHEHRSRDLDQARRFAEQTRRVAGAHRGIDQRLARLDRKIVRSVGPVPAPRDAFLWG
jgi:uncharacterized protein